MGIDQNRWLHSRGHLVRAKAHLARSAEHLEEAVEALDLAGVPDKMYKGLTITIKNLRSYSRTLDDIVKKHFSL